MPPKTPLLSSLIAAGLLAGCAGGPQIAAVPAGLTYECEPGGTAIIAFNGGGYLPDSTVWGTNEKGERVQIARSAAHLTYDGHRHDMVAEVAASGLRYRSGATVDGRHYLVWSTREADEQGGAEDAVLSLRGDGSAGEAGEREVARCTRSGRSADPAAEHHKQEDGQHDPHRR
jgi:hypothetical protein